MTGFIDALVACPTAGGVGDELWVLDYKSDTLGGDPGHAATAHVHAHYAVQYRLYSIAADRLRGVRRVGGMLFAFVRHGVTVALPFDGARLAEWTDWLASLREEAA